MSDIRVYSTDEVAELLQITRRTLYNYIKAGQLKAVKIGKTWKITEDALKDFLEQGTEEDYLERIGASRKKKK